MKKRHEVYAVGVSDSHRHRWRRSRALRAALAMVIALSVLAGAAWLFVVPAVVHHRVDELLRAIEPGRRAFRIEAIGWRELVVADVALGDQPWLTAGSIAIRYRIDELLGGRVEHVDFNTVVWNVMMRDGEMDWGWQAPAQRRSGPIALPFRSMAIAHSEIRAQIETESLVVPLSFAGSVDDAGMMRSEFGSEAVVLGVRSIVPFQGVMTFDGVQLDARIDWPLIEDSPLLITANLDVTGEHMAGGIEVQQPTFAIADASPVLDLVPALRGTTRGGRAAIAATLAIDGGAIVQRITVSAADVMLAHDDWPVAIAAAGSTLIFDSIAPLRTAGVQQVFIDLATTGPVDISACEVDLEIDDWNQMRVHHAQWFMSDGGRYDARPFTIDLLQPHISTRVSCTNVDLDFWLRLLTNDRADGLGRLRGEFAVEWNPQLKPRLGFSTGSLVATPPTGYVRVHDAPMLGDLLDISDPRFHVDQAMQSVKARIVDALTDFGYNRLRLDFVPGGEQAILRAEMEGQGRRGERGQEFSGLVVNIGHFADSLQIALDSVAASDRMRELRNRPRLRPVPAVGAPLAERP